MRFAGMQCVARDTSVGIPCIKRRTEPDRQVCLRNQSSTSSDLRWSSGLLRQMVFQEHQ